MRLAIIGWDGADPDVVEALGLEVKARARACARIDTYDNSAASWTSFTTGAPPEEHGVRDFRHDFDSSKLKHPRLWDKAPHLRWGVLNVPFTWPPRRLNGFIVPGIPCPVGRIDAYPRGLGRLLEMMGYVVHPAYLLDPTREPDVPRGEVYLRALRVEGRRLRCALFCARLYSVDVLFVVFSALDAVQHWLYDARELVEEAYRYVDRLTVRLLDELRPQRWVVLSDHGFRGAELGGYRGDHRPGGIWMASVDARPRGLEEAHREVLSLLAH